MQHILKIGLCMFMATNMGAMNNTLGSYTHFSTLLKTGAKYGLVAGAVTTGLSVAYTSGPGLITLANDAPINNPYISVMKNALPLVAHTVGGTFLGGFAGTMLGGSIGAGCYAGQKTALFLNHNGPKALVIGKGLGGTVAVMLLGGLLR